MNNKECHFKIDDFSQKDMQRLMTDYSRFPMPKYWSNIFLEDENGNYAYHNLDASVDWIVTSLIRKRGMSEKQVISVEQTLQIFVLIIPINYALIVRDMESQDYYQKEEAVRVDLGGVECLQLLFGPRIGKDNEYKEIETYRNFHSLEMAKLNLKDDDSSLFPSDRYSIWVTGDNSPNKQPHLYISSKREGWQLKYYIKTCDIWEVINPGKSGTKDPRTFSIITEMLNDWFKLPTKMTGRIGTNQEAAMNEWETCNED